MSTALSRLNSFLDTEMEQVLCFDTAVDAERFCQEKSAIFVVMPEENPNAYFMISLLIQQLYREILSVADENGGKLPNRVMFYCDEFGTMPPIQSAEMMYSASRSRRLSIVSIIQSYQQLEKNYGREGAAIIQDNCQITIVGGFAPTSETADIVSKTLGSRTVLTGSVSRSKNDPSQSLQMTERPLMSADELKNMKKGSFIVMKTGTHPFVSPLKLFLQVGHFFFGYALYSCGAWCKKGVLCQPGKNHAGYRQPVPTGQKAEDGSKQRWYESDRTAAESPHTNPHRLGGGCHAIFHKAVSDRSAASCQARLYLSSRPDGQ